MDEPTNPLSLLDRIAAFLRDRRAQDFPHARGRSLFDHLLGTRNILARWSQPATVQIAGLLHSIYATDKYDRQLIEFACRPQVEALAGARAERLAFLFCVTSRVDLGRQLARNPLVGESGLEIKRHAAPLEAGETLNREEIRSLIVLHMANSAEQACDSSGAPGLWIARTSWMGSRLRAFEGPMPPVFAACSAILTKAQEEMAREAYPKGLEALLRSPSQAESHFAAIVSACPFVAEPMIWKAYCCRHNGDSVESRRCILRARQTLSEWGAPWDKRLELDEWMRFLDYLEQEGRHPSGKDVLPGNMCTVDELLQAVKALDTCPGTAAACQPEVQVG
jgi:hypothetical protein